MPTTTVNQILCMSYRRVLQQHIFNQGREHSAEQRARTFIMDCWSCLLGQ